MTAGLFPPDVIAAALASGAKWDIPPSVCLAQWALESAWGRAMPAGSNNPFGIKATADQPSVLALTHEVLNGKDVSLPQRFRRFATIAEAFDCHGALLATGAAYREARAVRRNSRAFAAALQGHYATDPAYAAKLIALMDREDLDRFDSPHASVPPSPPILKKGHVSMLTNKWLQFGLSTLMTVLAGSASLDWAAVVSPTHAAGLATGIAAVKAVLNLLAPGPRVPVQPTGGTLITYTEI